MSVCTVPLLSAVPHYYCVTMYYYYFMSCCVLCVYLNLSPRPRREAPPSLGDTEALEPR